MVAVAEHHKQAMAQSAALAAEAAGHFWVRQEQLRRATLAVMVVLEQPHIRAVAAVAREQLVLQAFLLLVMAVMAYLLLQTALQPPELVVAAAEVKTLRAEQAEVAAAALALKTLQVLLQQPILVAVVVLLEASEHLLAVLADRVSSSCVTLGHNAERAEL